MTESRPRDSGPRPSPRSGAEASDGHDPTAAASALTRELRALEDIVARGLPALEQQLLKLETELPRLIREQNRGLPEWTDARVDQRLLPLQRLVRRTRGSAARVAQRIQDGAEDLRRLRERVSSLARELEREDPRLGRLEDRVARVARSVEQSRREQDRHIERIDARVRDQAEALEVLETRLDREDQRLEARLDTVEPRVRAELDRRFESLPRLEARLREAMADGERARREEDLQQRSTWQEVWEEWCRGELRARSELERRLEDELDILRRQMESLRRQRDSERRQVEERLQASVKGMEEPVRQLERRFDAAIREDRRRATAWRFALVAGLVLLAVWSLLR